MAGYTQRATAASHVRNHVNNPWNVRWIDFIVAEYSHHFIGFSQSTFSCLLYLRRKFLNLSSTFYDGIRPPWQITLSLDPLEQSFSMLKTSKKDCNAFQSGQRAECMFENWMMKS